MMAVTHSIAHSHTGPPEPPSVLMKFINCHLTARYTTDTGNFVTAFYGIYDPRTRRLTYSCAGHCPPRLKHAGRGGDHRITALEGALALPLGIDPDEQFLDVTTTLNIGDALILYTDGITESRRRGSTEMFGIARLDEVLDHCDCDPERLVRNTMLAVEEFTDSSAPTDDMTVLAVKVVG
jgi:sigma-B regulation protein RsbU (phosphoserine phosphatase)